MATLVFRREDLGAPAVRELIGALDQELSGRYPEQGANHFRLDAGEVSEGRGAFLVAHEDGHPVGCGAIRRLDHQVGEIKRMYVRPAARGRGIGSAILAALEAEARGLGVSRLVLEAGPRQPEALALYARAGFAPIARFGEYAGSSLSFCLGKPLD
jgi:GNAT superfamily N-acetyltransferase